MKAKSRSFLILTATLLVGMLLGALVQPQFFDKRVKRMNRLSTPEGFVESYIGTIEPTSEAQEAAVREVLAASAAEVHESFTKHRAELSVFLDAMQQKLAPLLEEEQMARIAERRARHQRK